ncbi:NnrU family protein [Ensifer sp. LCM 4579]|uniref:NnrU family protein n=1 Tax=Ensifer sp. LCM 4579 TaxID=1848292 RepID=UPI0008D9144E|nr:NnrU family protein [Ensifer sp. LCM 4579]OHV79962.1 NnrU family protein [Ensifer sp. LCM 4579]
MFVLILGLLIFLGVHSIRIFAPAWRDRRLADMGDGPWRGLYSLVSLTGFVLIIWGFAIARPDAPVLYEPPVWMKHIALALMPFAFISLMVFALPAGRLKPALKHPMLVSIKIWALAHLLGNGDLASLLLFGAFLAWAVADRISVKRRGNAVAAPGPITWDIGAVVAGVALYVLFVWRLHEWLFGATPLP